jgi:hypothetical protein
MSWECNLGIQITSMQTKVNFSLSQGAGVVREDSWL